MFKFYPLFEVQIWIHRYVLSCAVFRVNRVKTPVPFIQHVHIRVKQSRVWIHSPISISNLGVNGRASLLRILAKKYHNRTVTFLHHFVDFLLKIEHQINALARQVNIFGSFNRASIKFIRISAVEKIHFFVFFLKTFRNLLITKIPEFLCL